MKLIKDQEFGGERPLYREHDLRLENVVIHLGESAIKETHDIEAVNCRFEGKYVLWECQHFRVSDCFFAESARSSLWYSRDVEMQRCLVEAPKMFRRMTGVRLTDCQFPNAQETFWDCDDIHIRNCRIQQADYLFMHCHDIVIQDYHQDGNYSFQQSRNVEIHNAMLNTKDAFWEAENVTIYDSTINGEYLGWYSKNLRLVRCHITGEQPLCYIDGLTLEDCTFDPACDRAFEDTVLNATIRGHITEIKNPISGHIVADSVGKITIDEHIKQPANCIIETR